MSESRSHDPIEGVVSYAKELVETSRTLLGLSSLGVGFVITLLKDARPYPSRPTLAVALGFFLCSTLLWLTVSMEWVKVRSIVSQASVRGWSDPLLSEAGTAEKLMLKFFAAQRFCFTVGIFLSCLWAVAVGFKLWGFS